MLKVETAQRLSLLHWTVSQVVNTKENFLKEMSSAVAAAWMARRWNSDCWHEDALVWPEEWTSHSILLNQSPIQSKAQTPFQALKDERYEEAVEEKSDVSRGWSMKFKERRHFPNMKVQDEAVGADAVEVATSYPEDVAEIMNEGGHTKQQISKCR